MKRRAPNLTSVHVNGVVELIRAWQGRLTWPALIKTIAQKFGAIYTRQALFKHDRIRIAYETYRDAAHAKIRAGSGRPMSAALKAAMGRIHRLEQENSELRKREMLLLEQFHRWAYHASSRGLTQEFLDRPLPPLNRRGNRMPPRKATIIDSM
jgi:hypothetical protein